MDKIEMKELLIKASNAYYNDSESIISDEEFDNLKDQFAKLYPDDDFLKQIGATVSVSEWKKAKHNIPMSSLNKVNTTAEFKKWANSIGDSFYILEEKLDGISVDLEYAEGKLIKAITRGNGIIGEDIYNNVKLMKNVKLNINNFTGSLRGEIVLFNSDFEKLNEVMRSKGNKEFSNPRNAASGIAKKFDGTNSEYLTVLYYDVTGDFKAESDKMFWLHNQGLKTSFWKKCTVDECIELYNDYEKTLRAKLDYDVDGLVGKANSIDIQTKHGLLGDNPKAQIAWKFTSMKAETTVEGIEWSRGNGTHITPVALLNPIKLGGVVVRRASLHNMEMFRKLNLGKGDRVLISRRNDVIPYVESVIEYVSHIKIKPPLSCPECEEELVESDKFLECLNIHCSGAVLGNLNRFVKSLDVYDISERTIELFYKAGLVKEPADFYKLKIENISTLEGMGKKSATNIITNFSNKKEIDLMTFIDSLNIFNFSGSRAKILMDAGINTIDKMLSINQTELINIKGIGTEVADAIVYGLSSKKPVIKNLLEVINIIQPKEINMSSNKLVGKSFCFTGAILKIDEAGNKYTRERMEALVIENGGQVSSVKKGLSYLVQADPLSQSSKSVKAKSLGINILSEVDFFKMLGM